MLIDERPMTSHWIAQWLEFSGAQFRVLAVPNLDEPQRSPCDSETVELAIVNIGAALASDPGPAAIFDQLRRRLPGRPIVVISHREDVAAAVEALRRGLRGYIPTSLDPHIALEALRFVQAGGTFVPADLWMAHLQTGGPGNHVNGIGGEAPVGLFGLTRRELEVLDRLQQGEPNKIIARELDMQESTVKVHVRQIMKKLNASNRTQAAYMARQLRLGLDTSLHEHA